MSLTFIRPYFSSKLAAAGYEEWPDGFGEDNIPSTILDRSFHQRTLSAQGNGINQESFEMDTTHRLRVFFKGFNNPSSAIDEGLAQSEALIASILNLKDYTDAGITGLFFNSFSIDPLDDASNDNIVVATLNFSIMVYVCIS